jgi:hypothetical protein
MSARALARCAGAFARAPLYRFASRATGGPPARSPEGAAPADGTSVALAQLMEQIKVLRAEAAARDAEAAARYTALREEAAARDAKAAARDAEAAARIAALRFEVVALREGNMLSPLARSYASVGVDSLAALSANGVIFSPGAGAGPPIATPDDLARLRACATEPELVAAITPLLRAARGFDEPGAAADSCARVLVNSENTAWLDALPAPQTVLLRKKPDLFVTWTPFWSGRVDPARGAFGKLAARALQLDGCASEYYEAKVGVGELTPAAFGQLVDYHSRVRGPVRGMLFNARAFWLYESARHSPGALTKGELGAHGSREMLRAFFNAAPEPPLVPLLRHLCSALGVAPHRITAAGAAPTAADATTSASAFLGAGGSARVFCVAAKGAAAPHALKASVTLSRAELEYEFAALARAAAAGAPVVPAVPGSLVFFVDDAGVYCGGGFLLRDVCARAVLGSRARVAAAFDALRALHAAGMAHGDARLPNLVARAQGARAELLWIDPRAADVGALASAQRADARTLAVSALDVAHGDVLPARVNAALGAVPAGGGAAYAALAAAVWQGFAKEPPRW